MSAAAFAVHREFPAAPARPFRMDRHYLLYAARGAMRLEANGRSWSLPPARAALIAAGHEVMVTLPQPLTARSALFSTDFTDPPPAPLTVFEVSPLARALLEACSAWTDAEAPLDRYATGLFQALAQVAWRLALTPSRATMPAGRSPLVRRALELTAARMAEDPRFDRLAGELAVTPRTLARHISAELGMPWRDALRRMRMIRAIELLADGDAPVTGIAFAVGYGSISAFNAAFRDLMDTSPTAYRASFRPPPPG